MEDLIRQGHLRRDARTARGQEEQAPRAESAFGLAEYENDPEVLTGEGTTGGTWADSGPGLTQDMDTDTPFGATGTMTRSRGRIPPSALQAVHGGPQTRLQVYVHPDTELHDPADVGPTTCDREPEEPKAESAHGSFPKAGSGPPAPPDTPVLTRA